MASIKLNARRRLYSWWVQQKYCPKPMDKLATSANVIAYLKSKLPTLKVQDARDRIKG